MDNWSLKENLSILLQVLHGAGKLDSIIVLFRPWKECVPGWGRGQWCTWSVSNTYVYLYIPIYRREESLSESLPLAIHLNSKMWEESERKLFVITTVWRHLLNLALSRSSLPLPCSPCAGEMGWDLGMDWVIFPPSWVERLTSQTLFLILFLIHVHTAKPWSLQFLHAQDCQRSPSIFPCRKAVFQTS